MANSPAESKSPKFEWRDIWLIPYLTALIYFSTFAYQFVYNSLFGLPSYLVEVDIPKLAQTAGIVVVFYIAKYFAAELSSMSFGLDLRKQHDNDRLDSIMLAYLLCAVGLGVLYLILHGLAFLRISSTNCADDHTCS